MTPALCDRVSDLRTVIKLCILLAIYAPFVAHFFRNLLADLLSPIDKMLF